MTSTLSEEFLIKLSHPIDRRAFSLTQLVLSLGLTMTLSAVGFQAFKANQRAAGSAITDYQDSELKLLRLEQALLGDARQAISINPRCVPNPSVDCGATTSAQIRECHQRYCGSNDCSSILGLTACNQIPVRGAFTPLTGLHQSELRTWTRRPSPLSSPTNHQSDGLRFVLPIAGQGIRCPISSLSNTLLAESITLDIRSCNSDDQVTATPSAICSRLSAGQIFRVTTFARDADDSTGRGVINAYSQIVEATNVVCNPGSGLASIGLSVVASDGSSSLNLPTGLGAFGIKSNSLVNEHPVVDGPLQIVDWALSPSTKQVGRRSISLMSAEGSTQDFTSLSSDLSLDRIQLRVVRRLLSGIQADRLACSASHDYENVFGASLLTLVSGEENPRAINLNLSNQVN